MSAGDLYLIGQIEVWFVIRAYPKPIGANENLSQIDMYSLDGTH